MSDCLNTINAHMCITSACCISRFPHHLDCCRTIELVQEHPVKVYQSIRETHYKEWLHAHLLKQNMLVYALRLEIYYGFVS